MKLKITSILLLAVVASFVAFTPKADVYKIDLTQSSISWEGKKFAGSHTGTVDLTSGNLDFNGKKLAGGGFVANMTTIKTMDGGTKPNAGLDKHLKADDFFGVEKFPAANFVVKKVTGNGAAVNVTGDLTIKGITQSVTFPATLVWNADKSVTATAEKIVIDRTKFGIQFKSKSVFANIGDNFIYDEFTISVKLVAKK
ncbi:YceI family protein [Pedobacter frigiditerrae]|uniref:YceI family protein n=1 Tax=Pedobacter frigiditerrae TaxID=2530452 RepID=A0A4R0N8A2_9SPHI|nr:YceI family protein [Pedobacter frigiditerrae]TCC94454.1 YceI family protein [Pedobacter frigiditerrae]